MRGQVEDFRPEHLQGVVALCLAEGWASYGDAPTTLRALTAPGSIALVAVDEYGSVVGFLQLQTDGFLHAHLSMIVVAPSCRRSGLARALIEVAFERSGARYLELVSTEGADDFYRTFEHKAFPGFRIYPEVPKR